jgi:hypothetical protein
MAQLSFFAIPLTGKRFFLALFLAGLEVERVTLDFLNYVFLLNLALEAPQSAFERFPILDMDFRQS